MVKTQKAAVSNAKRNPSIDNYNLVKYTRIHVGNDK